MIKVLLLQGYSEIHASTLVDMNCKFSDDYHDLECSLGLLVIAESEGNKMQHCHEKLRNSLNHKWKEKGYAVLLAHSSPGRPSVPGRQWMRLGPPTGNNPTARARGPSGPQLDRHSAQLVLGLGLDVKDGKKTHTVLPLRKFFF